MELTRITKLPPVAAEQETRHRGAERRVSEPEPTDWEQVLDFEELYADLTPQEKQALQVGLLK